MSKKLIGCWILFFFGFIMQSCKNYYYLKHTPAIKNEDGNNTHTLKFAHETIPFTTYADYHYNTVNKKYIFFTTKEVSRILNSKFKKPFNEQFLFMYTNMSIYNNLLGFYYEGISLEDVKKSYDRMPDVDLGNGALYTYRSEKFNVVDIYRKSEGGVIRFVNLNNPDEEDPQNKKFHREVNTLFFNLNSNLWDKSAVDFQ
ncbi:hypothetical protein KB553_19210 [Chryseobacterium rhizoplanae]|uniref:hypothetical protein n=1 Tax=Chryseobacterium TaxID=59732 RepID=UPI001CE327CA|nr:hypothetical protein [Chryseobacterium rhizoplanae]UCA59142.1 hypothetical protein KB553_19210 [Chryseobacterium rhizoplanae]